MFEMTGVMTPKVQLTPTVATSPISGVPSPSASVNVGLGAVCTPPTTGKLQFVAAASARISFWYLAWAWRRFAWTSGSYGTGTVQAVGLFAAKFAAIRAMFWRLM